MRRAGLHAGHRPDGTGAGVPVADTYESRGYELTGITPAGTVSPVTSSLTAFGGATDIGYEVLASGGSTRAAAQPVAVLFRDDTLAPLPPASRTRSA